MTTRRRILLAGAPAALDWRITLAQARPAKIGMLSARPLAESVYASRVVKRLQELGYLQQRGARLEFRSADGYVARYPKLARKLIDAKCDLIFAIGPPQAVLALPAQPRRQRHRRLHSPGGPWGEAHADHA